MTTKRLLSAAAICSFAVLLVSAGPALAQPEALCVDWVPSDPTVPHYLYSGAQTTLKGIARGDATCLLYTSPSPRDATLSRMPSSA